MATIGIGIDESTRDSSPTDANLRANSLTLNSSDPYGPGWDGSNEVPTKDALWSQLSTSANTIMLFALAGQSNAGTYNMGTGVANPVNGTFQWTSGGGVEPLSNSVSESDGGVTFGWTMVPQFANTYRVLTGKNVGFVGRALSGTAQVALADSGVGNWDVTGTMRSELVDRYNNAKAAFIANGYNVIDAGILWLQGEQDAAKIADGTITQAAYQTALTTMIGYFRTNINADLPFYIVRTGQRTSAATTGSYSVRMGQEAVAAADPSTHIVYRDTMNFSVLGYMGDTVHYNAAGQNDIGEKSAEYVLGLNKPYVATAATVAVTADNQVVQVNDKEVINLLSNNGTAANRTILLSPPLRPGHKLTLVNASGTFFVQLVAGSAITQTGSSEIQGTVQLSATWAPSTLNDTLNLISPNGFDWVEISAGGGGGGGGGVTSIVAGNGITVSSATGDVTISAPGSYSGVLGTAVASTTVASTTTETSLVGTLNSGGSKTTGANFFQAGTMIRIDWSGYFSSLVTDTLTVRVKAGSTTVGATAAVAYGAVSNQVMRVWAEVTCRTAGVSGTFIVNTFAETAGAQSQLLNTSTVTLDTTGTLVWDVTAQWSLASGSNTITGTNFVIYGLGTVPKALVAHLTGDTTTTSSSAVDTGLVVSLEAASKYTIEFIISCGCNNTGGLYFGLQDDGTATKRVIGTANITTASSLQRWTCGLNTLVTGTPINTVNSTGGYINSFGTITTVNATTLKGIFASVVAGQTSTVFQNGSYLRATKLI